MRTFLVVSSIVGTLATAGIASAEPCRVPTSTMTTYGGTAVYAPAPVYTPAPVYVAPPTPVVYAPRPTYYPAPVYRDPYYRQPVRTWRAAWHHGRRW